MDTFLAYGEASAGSYHLLIVEKERGLFRVYASVDGQRFRHCDTVEHQGSLEEVIHSTSANFDPRLFEAHPVTPFSRQEVLARAPHAFDAL